MPVGITLWRWTDQGLRNVQGTVTRAREASAALAKIGAKVTTYWTQGRYDMVSIDQGGGPDEETSMAMLLGLLKAGNLRAESLRAFTIDEMERIVKKVP